MHSIHGGRILSADERRADWLRREGCISSVSIGPLERALATLEEAVRAHQAAPGDLVVRDGAIQRFEYTFELAWKTLKRYFEERGVDGDADQWSRRDLFRVAGEQGLLHDPAPWFEYHRARNLTSHAYDEAIAQVVQAALAPFCVDCGALLATLRERLGDARH